MTRVVVVGAGIAGLAAGHALVSAGETVTVLEAAPQVGGKLRVSDIAGVPVDEGAEAFLQRTPDVRDLAAAVGLAGEVVTPVTTAASVWARGALRPIPPRTVLGVPSDPRLLAGVLSRREVARVAADRLLPGAPPGEDVAVGEWVGRRVGRAVVDRLVDPLLGGVHAGRADELSLAATLPQLPRDERSALAAARRALPSGPADAPAFATLRSGLGSLPAAVAAAIRRAGGVVETGRTVRRLDRVPGGWRVVHGATTDERVIAADAVVLAVPAAPAARLLSQVTPAAATELTGVESASMAIVTTVWRTDDAPRLSGSGYLVPASVGRPVKAVTLTSVKWPHLADSDRFVVRCSIGRHREVVELQRDDSDLIQAAVEELTMYAGAAHRPVEARVTRWGGGLPQYAVGHRQRVARIMAAVAEVPGLAVCGASYDGVGVPACIRSGLAAAAAVRNSPAR